MKDMILNVLKDSNKIEYLIAPIHYDNKSKTILSLSSENIDEKPVVKNSKELFSYLRKFPGRIMRNIKLELNEDEFLIYASNLKYLAQGWHGITIIRTEKKYMPVNRELELSNKCYEAISKDYTNYFKNKKMKKLGQELTKLIILYNHDLSKQLLEVRRNKGEKYSLENVITPNSNYTTKWDFFAFKDDGSPITDILRYYSGMGFLRLDMEKEVVLESYKAPLKDLHLLNCMSLSNLNSSFKELGEKLGFKNAKLRHLSSYLFSKENYLGVGFTFINEVKINKETILLVLDVKNKLPNKDKYIDKLFGNERETLDAIKNKLKESYSLNQEKIFKTAKEVINKKKII